MSFDVCQNPIPGQLVHVEGWKPACVFHFIRREGGVSVLETPKTRRVYRTSNRLLETRRNTNPVTSDV